MGWVISFIVICFLLALSGFVGQAEAAVQKIAVGDSHNFAIMEDGTLWGWGDNGSGRLGDGTDVNRDIPVQIGVDSNWKVVSAGGLHTVALKEDGTLWAWGDNYYGQLGDGTNGDGAEKYFPTQIGTESDWVAVSAGRTRYTVALKSDGTLWSWGIDDWGEQRDWEWPVEHSFKNTPTMVGNDKDWAAVSAGYRHIVALKTDGTLWAWGDNDYGELGDGTDGLFERKTTPTPVYGGHTDWSAISAGTHYTMALKENGTLWAWGLNGSGRLGDGTQGNRNKPTEVDGGVTDWTAVEAYNTHTVALKADGTLWSWGHNTDGRLGDGTQDNRNKPTQVYRGDTDWIACGVGFSHTVALKANGTAWVWGYNNGTLGDGTEEQRKIPVRVAFSRSWTRLAPENAVAMAYDDGKLAVAFKEIGLWQYDGAWTRLAPENALALAYDHNGILAVAFEEIGVWEYDGSGWTRLAPENAVALAYDDGKLAVAFNEIGLWQYNGAWTRLAPEKALSLAFDGGIIAVAFKEIGVWSLWPTTWIRLAPEPATALAYDALAIDYNKLVVAFSEIGLWRERFAIWTRLAPESATALTYGYNELVVAFEDIGVWLYQGTWSRLAPENVVALAYDAGSLAVAFEDIGVWLYD